MKLVSNGKFGIVASSAILKSANTVYDLYKAVYLDDGKVNAADLPDLFKFGPSLVTHITTAAQNAKGLGDEITDLSEGEKDALEGIAGERLKDPAYNKIVSGLLDVVDGIVEIVKEDTPTS